MAGMGGAMKIVIEAPEVIEALQDISAFVKNPSAKEVAPRSFFEEVYKLRFGFLKNGTVCILPPTTRAGNHVIRLGVGWKLKVLATAVRTLDFDGF